MNPSQHPFLVLLEQHSGAIRHVCRSFCHATPEDMEDLYQEIVMNLWQGWQHYKPTHKSVTWVWRIATNTAISWLRHRNRRPSTISIDFLQLPDTDSSDVELLYSLIQRLPRADQQLLQLYLDGWNHAEIAEMLHTTQTNVQTRLYRIRIKMKVMNT